MLTLIIYLTSSLGIATFLFLTAQIIPSKLNIWKMVLLSLSFGLLAPLKLQFEWNSTIFTLLNIVAFSCMICVLIFLYKGKFLKRCIVFGYFMIVWMLSDCASVALFTLYYGDIGHILSEVVPYLLYITFGSAVHIFVGSVSVMVWRMISVRKFQPFYLLFFILPIGQLITIYSFIFSTWTVFWLLGVLLSLVADLVLLAYTISQEKKTQLEEELREARHQMELEQFHYREVEQRREELAKIRHDFNNQLASVTQLVLSSENGSAQELIRSLADEISKTEEFLYCAIPVVNAILTEKAQECLQAHIGLEVELDIPARISVEPMHLCSVFSNLLDNAITACKQVPDEKKPVILLSSKVDGDYLFIKAVNPSVEPPKKPLPGHGYGSRILSDLAARYSGNYKSEYRDGMFTAVVSLLAAE